MKLALIFVTLSAIACGSQAQDANPGEEEHHHGHGEAEQCACAAAEEIHPFTLDCADTAQLEAATAKLLSADCEPTEESCEAVTDGVQLCQSAFFVIQSHHDFCDHDTLTEEQEHLVHDFEAACLSCEIGRPFDAELRNCNQPQCEISEPAEAAFNLLEAQCDGTTCCTTSEEQAAYATLYEYHELCDEDDMTEGMEHALHEFEEMCEAFGECNAPASLEEGYEPDHCDEVEHGHDDDDHCALADDGNGDGVVNIVDLLSLLGAFGCTCDTC